MSGRPDTAELVVFGRHLLRMTPVSLCSEGCTGQLQIAPVGSATWSTVTPKTSALYESHIAVHGNVAYFQSGDYAGGKGGGIYRSTDGVHWHNISARPCGNDYYELIAGFDGSVAVNCDGAHYTVRVATPGANAFGTAQRLPGHSPTLVALSSAQTILTIDGTKLYRSTDGGASFEPLGTIDVDATHGVTPTAVSANFMYVPSTNGQLLVSTDGGATWQPRTF